MEEECTLLRILDQVSLSMVVCMSFSLAVLIPNMEGQSKLEISPRIDEIAPLSVGFKDMMVSIILLDGLFGNCGIAPLTKCLISRYLNKCVLGRLNFFDICSKEANLLAIKRSLRLFRPLSCCTFTAESCIEGGKRWLDATGLKRHISCSDI